MSINSGSFKTQLAPPLPLFPTSPFGGAEVEATALQPRFGPPKLIRQVHLAQKSLVAGIRAQAAEIRINLEPRDSRVSLHIGALSPLERLIGSAIASADKT